MEEFGESEMSEESLASDVEVSSDESMQDLDKNAQIYSKLQDQEEID